MGFAGRLQIRNESTNGIPPTAAEEVEPLAVIWLIDRHFPPTLVSILILVLLTVV